jgi:hypothetical protein
MLSLKSLLAKKCIPVRYDTPYQGCKTAVKVAYLKVVILAVLRHPAQVGVRVQKVLPSLRNLRCDQGIQISSHSSLLEASYKLSEQIRIMQQTSRSESNLPIEY